MPSSTAHDVVVDASATTSGSIAAAATVSLMMLALYVMMRRQPRRRGGRFMRSHVYVQIRVESGAAVLAGIAWPDRSGGLSQALALCASSDQERSNLGVIESRMMKPRVVIHAYLGLRRLLA